MSAVSLPVNRSHGRALVVAGPPCQSQPVAIMQRLGFECAPVADPYAAMIELCQRPLVYRAVVLSLQSLFREELTIVQAIKRQLPHLEIWLAHTDGRQAAMAEAQRMGADGLLSDDGLHRTASTAIAAEIQPIAPTPVVQPEPVEENASDDPVLSTEELRALLQEPSSNPPAGGNEP